MSKCHSNVLQELFEEKEKFDIFLTDSLLSDVKRKFFRIPAKILQQVCQKGIVVSIGTISEKKFQERNAFHIIFGCGAQKISVFGESFSHKCQNCIGRFKSSNFMRKTLF